MSSYTGNPAGSPIDAVRFVVGDTNPAAPLYTDAEWQYLLDLAGGDVQLAALRGAQGLLARFAYEVDETVGAVSIHVSQRMANLRDLIALLQARLGETAGGPMPYAGGIDVADREARANNPTTTRPFFDPRYGGTSLNVRLGRPW